MSNCEVLDLKEQVAADYDRRIKLLLDEVEILMHQKDAALRTVDELRPYLVGEKS